MEVAVTAINFGSHQQNGRMYNYWGFDGAISIDPLSLDVRGEEIKFFCSVDNEEMVLPEGETAAIIKGMYSFYDIYYAKAA